MSGKLFVMGADTDQEAQPPYKIIDRIGGETDSFQTQEQYEAYALSLKGVSPFASALRQGAN